MTDEQQHTDSHAILTLNPTSPFVRAGLDAMSSSFRQQASGTEHSDIKAQIAATHNPLFPFSSPNINDRSPSAVARNGYVSQIGNPFGSTSSTPSLTTDTGDTTSIGDGSYFDTYSRGTRTRMTPAVSVIGSTVSQKRQRPGLKVVTDFSKPSIRTGNLVFHEVPAKRPEQGRNRARSIVSQKGIKGLPSPLLYKKPAEALSTLKTLISGAREKRQNVGTRPEMSQRSASGKRSYSPTRSSVVFGLCVPESEAPMHRQGDVLESAVTLVTPLTPKIVVTPAEGESAQFRLSPPQMQTKARTNGSPSSLYSRSISQYGRPTVAERAPPMPEIPTQFSAKSKIERRSSSDSKEQILPESGDTARPVSQGWWNLMLSPMLSRAGTLRTVVARQKEDIPPVPPVSAEQNKSPPIFTPMTNFSPETPRRLGLADVRASTWSRWTEWEKERDLSEGLRVSFEEPIPAIPEEHLARDFTAEAPATIIEGPRGEGLAAEYFHACAIEQLTGITYFECINHSCSEHLPKLCSVYDNEGTRSGATAQVRGSDETQGAPRALSKYSNEKTAKTTHLPAAAAASGIVIAQPAISTEAGSPSAKHPPVTPSVTDIDPEEFVSPNVRQASAAAFSRARAVDSREPSPRLSPPTSQPAMKELPKETILSHPQHFVESPGPMSPEASRALAPHEATPLAPIQTSTPNAQPTVMVSAPDPTQIYMPQPQHAAPPPIIYYPPQQVGSYPMMMPQQPYPYYMAHQAYGNPGDQLGQARELSQFENSSNGNPLGPTGQQEHSEPHLLGVLAPIGYTGLVAENKSMVAVEQKEEQGEGDKKEKKKFVLAGVCCFGRDERKARRKTLAIAVVLLLIIILCIVLAITLTRKGNVNPIQSQWLNLTGYPAMPTGIATIARPNLVSSQNQCVQPNTLWSCSLPKEDQASISPNDPDQPNFRFQIRFRNGTVATNLTQPLTRRASDDDLFAPNPTPPGLPDQLFLGNTTDNVTQPFDGEETPFYITFMSASSTQPSANTTRKLLVRRQSPGQETLNSIPAPDIGPDGTAAPTSLLPDNPFPISQPVKLYNKGRQDEHYGFYIYYDKSIFLSGVQLENGTAVNGSLTPVSADQNGGSTKQAANVRCTFAQTRFIVKIYTNPSFEGTLLSGPPTNNSTSSSSKQSKDNIPIDSATDFDRPGSFPYPTTITLDRHGGDVNKKIAFCYGMDAHTQDIISDQKILISEIRSFGGTLINPSPQILTANSSTFDSSLGGIDGGTGGCGCSWQNWS